MCIQWFKISIIKNELVLLIMGINKFLFVSEQLHQNIEVLDHNILAAESAWAVPAAGQLLLLVSVGAAANPGHLVADPHHHRHPAHRRTRAHCRQRRLRRLCKSSFSFCFITLWSAGTFSNVKQQIFQFRHQCYSRGLWYIWWHQSLWLTGLLSSAHTTD